MTELTTRVVETGRSLGTARETLFGFNIEWITDVPAAITSERLDNPTFFGPADPQSGLARPWSKVMQFQGGLHFDLAEGHNMAGGPAQRVHVYDHQATGGGAGMVQPHRWVRAGETLRVTVWARCQGEPVELRVGFRHHGLAGPDYGSATFTVEYSHFREYTVDIPIKASDDDCLFFCYLTGNGMVYFDRISVHPVDEPVYREDTLAAMRELGIGDIRWPGGCVSSNYHWRNGVGPNELRYNNFDATFFWGLCYTWGTDEYLELCRRVGARPHITLNIGTGTPREAGEWAAYCAEWYRTQGIEPPEMVWQVGNEHPGPHEIGHMSGEMYARTLKEFAPRIRENYPRPIICTSSAGSDWLRVLLDEAPEYFDLFATHFYACRVDFNPEREGLAFLADATGNAACLDQLDALLTERNAPQGVAITEWGAFRGETHTDAKFFVPHTTRTSLFVAAMLNHYCRRATRVQLANNYSLINTMATIVARGSRAEHTALHQLFRFWRPLFPAEILEVENQGPCFVPPQSQNDPDKAQIPWQESMPAEGEGAIPWIDALQGRSDAGDWLLLTNRHPEQAIEVEVPARFQGAKVEFLLPTADYREYIWPAEAEVLSGTTVVLPGNAHCRVVNKGI